VLSQGFDERRVTFLQAFGEPDRDAAVLRLPTYDFLPYDDERVVRTVGVVRETLGEDGLLRR
jgi:GH15 family glucan-1,4-alpha-glucosidase